MDNRYYVYVYLDTSTSSCKYGNWKFDHEPFYVGKGCSYRYRAHLSNSRNTGVKNKIAKLRRLGYEPEVVLKREGLSEKEALRIEQTLIALIGRRDLKDGPLFNYTAGGDGYALGSKGARKVSDSAKRKRSESLKRYWATVSKKAKADRVAKMREVWKDPKAAVTLQAKACARKSEKFEKLSPTKKKKYREKLSEIGKKSSYWNTETPQQRLARGRKMSVTVRGEPLILISPRGTKYTVESLPQFCQRFSSLSYETARKLRKGQTSASGWTRK